MKCHDSTRFQEPVSDLEPVSAPSSSFALTLCTRFKGNESKPLSESLYSNSQLYTKCFIASLKLLEVSWARRTLVLVSHYYFIQSRNHKMARRLKALKRS
jgi:hypothetical protein